MSSMKTSDPAWETSVRRTILWVLCGFNSYETMAQAIHESVYKIWEGARDWVLFSEVDVILPNQCTTSDKMGKYIHRLDMDLGYEQHK